MNYKSVSLGTTATTTTTTTTTTTPTPSSCGNPQWFNDGYCDDENNNPGCNFDGGDCCNNNNPNWDAFCTVIYNHAFLINNPLLIIFCNICIGFSAWVIGRPITR